MSLNDYIGTSNQFTSVPDKIPDINRQEQVSYGMEMAQRAAQQAQVAPEPVKVMPPIMPVAN